jgi:hypothetical protein
MRLDCRRRDDTANRFCGVKYSIAGRPGVIMVAVSLLAIGKAGYALAAQEAVASILAHSNFDVFVIRR